MSSAKLICDQSVNGVLDKSLSRLFSSSTTTTTTEDSTNKSTKSKASRASAARTAVSTESPTHEFGVLIGAKRGDQYVVVAAIPTPKMVDDDEDLIKGSGLSLDESEDTSNASELDWVQEHSHQVKRMLPGGLLVAGLYLLYLNNESVYTDSILAASVCISASHDMEEPILIYPSRSRKFLVKRATRASATQKLPLFSSPGDLRFVKDLRNELVCWLVSVNVDFDSYLCSSDPSAIESLLLRFVESMLFRVDVVNHQVKVFYNHSKNGQDKLTHSETKPQSTADVPVQRIVLSGGLVFLATSFRDDPANIVSKHLTLDAKNSVSARVELFTEQQQEMGPMNASDVWLPQRVLVTSLIYGRMQFCDYTTQSETVSDVTARAEEILAMVEPKTQALEPISNDSMAKETMENGMSTARAKDVPVAVSLNGTKLQTVDVGLVTSNLPITAPVVAGSGTKTATMSKSNTSKNETHLWRLLMAGWIIVVVAVLVQLWLRKPSN